MKSMAVNFLMVRADQFDVAAAFLLVAVSRRIPGQIDGLT
jgi:hypothetical protein